MRSTVSRTVILAAVVSLGGARAQSTGASTSGSTGGTGSPGQAGTTGQTGQTSQGGAAGSGAGGGFDALSQAAARTLGIYRVPGAGPLDTTGVYRVDTGSAAAAAGGTSGTPGSTTAGSTTGATTSTATGSAGTTSSLP